MKNYLTRRLEKLTEIRDREAELFATENENGGITWTNQSESEQWAEIQTQLEAIEHDLSEELDSEEIEEIKKETEEACWAFFHAMEKLENRIAEFSTPALFFQKKLGEKMRSLETAGTGTVYIEAEDRTGTVIKLRFGDHPKGETHWNNNYRRLIDYSDSVDVTLDNYESILKKFVH